MYYINTKIIKLNWYVLMYYVNTKIIYLLVTYHRLKIAVLAIATISCKLQGQCMNKINKWYMIRLKIFKYRYINL